MRRIWILAILVGLATAVFLTYLYVPPVKEWLVNVGIAPTIQDGVSGIIGAVNNLSPSSLLTALVTSVGSLSLIIRNQLAKAREKQVTLQNVRVAAQEKEGMLKATFEDAKELLTGNVSQLEGQLVEAKSVIDGKDKKIMEVQDELSKAQQTLAKMQTELKEAIIQRDEYQIKNKELERVTNH